MSPTAMTILRLLALLLVLDVSGQPFTAAALAQSAIVHAPTTTKEAPKRTLAGRWSVAYADAVLGRVEGEAAARADGSSVRVTLTHPKTKREYTLRSSDVDWEGDTVTVVLKGRSPESERVDDPDPYEHPRVIADPEAERLRVRVNKKTTASAPLTWIADPGSDTVILTLRHQDDGSLVGTWRSAADAITERDANGLGRVGRFSRTTTDDGKLLGFQEGDEAWVRTETIIDLIIVADDQTGTAYGNLKSPYARPSPDARGTPVWERLAQSRTLLVIGRFLPRNYQEVMSLESDAPETIEYEIEAYATDEAARFHAPVFEEGWSRLRGMLSGGGMSPDKVDEVIDRLGERDAILIRAYTKAEAQPGDHAFRLNGARGEWTLRYGGNEARLGIARTIQSDETEITDTVFPHDVVRIKLATRYPLTVDSFDVVLGKNDEVVALGGKPVLTLRRLGPEPAWEPRKKGIPAPTVYLSDTIALHRPGSAPDDDRATHNLAVETGNRLHVRLTRPDMLNLDPPTGQAWVNRAPAALGTTWKEALAKAAKCAGIEDVDFNTIGTKKAEEISNLIITELASRSIRVTVADHAAMLLLREEYVRMARRQLREYQQIQGAGMNRAFAERIRPSLDDKRSPFNRITITAPNGHPVSIGSLWMDDWVTEYFGLTNAEFADWRARAEQELVDTLRSNVRESIDKARDVDDCDVEDLLEITGVGFDAVGRQLLPRLLKLEETGSPPRLRWVPDLTARSAVMNLDTLGAAVMAQEDYADIDTAVAITAASAILLPVGWVGEAALFLTQSGTAMGTAAAAYSTTVSAAALAVDAVDLGVTLGHELPEYLSRRSDTQFARGAMMIAGSEVYDTAQQREKTALEVLVAVGGASLGTGFSSLEAYHNLSRVMRSMDINAIRRSGAAVTDSIADGGLARFGELSDEQRAIFAHYAADARQVRDTAGDAALTPAQRRALETLETLEQEATAARASRPDLPDAPDVTMPRTEPLRPADAADALPTSPDAVAGARPDRTVPPSHVDPESPGLTGALDDAVQPRRPRTEPPIEPPRETAEAPVEGRPVRDPADHPLVPPSRDPLARPTRDPLDRPARDPLERPARDPLESEPAPPGPEARPDTPDVEPVRPVRQPSALPPRRDPYTAPPARDPDASLIPPSVRRDPAVTSASPGPAPMRTEGPTTPEVRPVRSPGSDVPYDGPVRTAESDFTPARPPSHFDPDTPFGRSPAPGARPDSVPPVVRPPRAPAPDAPPVVRRPDADHPFARGPVSPDLQPPVVRQPDITPPDRLPRSTPHPSDPPGVNPRDAGPPQPARGPPPDLEKVPLEGSPLPGSRYIPEPGADPIELGEYLGRGRYGEVYAIKGAPGDPPRVIKLYRKPDDAITPIAETVRNIIKGSRLLPDDIAQLPIRHANPDAPRPYIIQDALEPGKHIAYKIDGLSHRNFPIEHQEALLSLYQRLGKNGLVWEDGHIENVYFFKRNGVWEAGILDTDRLVRFGDYSGDFGEVLKAIEMYPGVANGVPHKIFSLQGNVPRGDFPETGSIFPDASFFMEKMLEYDHRYMRFNGRAFEPVLIDPRLVEKYFPDFAEHVRYDLANGRQFPDAPPLRFEGVTGPDPKLRTQRFEQPDFSDTLRFDQPDFDETMRFDPLEFGVGDPPRHAFNPAEPRAARNADDLRSLSDELDQRLARSRERLAARAENADATPAQKAYAKDRVDELEQRRAILDELIKETGDTGVPLSKSDIEYLTGKRRFLTPTEMKQARGMLQDTFNSSWDAAASTLSKGDAMDKLALQRLGAFRKQYVDSLLTDVMRSVESRTGGALQREAFGSTNLTSDYDLSISGRGAELVPGEFNRRFRQTFGVEPGTMFDTNVYTRPVYDFIDPNSAFGRNMTPVQRDTVRQFVYEQMANVKYKSPAQWQRHTERIIDSAPDDLKGTYRRLLKEVESRQAAGEQTFRDAARQRGIDPDDISADLELQIRNELYARSLERIHEYRQLADGLAQLRGDATLTRADVEDFMNLNGVRDPSLEGTAFANRLDAYVAARAGRDQNADAMLKDLEATVNSHLRHHQGNALYFASEAYQTQGTIAHVVGELQAGKRLKKLTPADLLKDPPSSPGLTPGQYISSYYENEANLFKELNSVLRKMRKGGLTTEADIADALASLDRSTPERIELAEALAQKAAIKTSKYFVRQLDAAHRAGVPLNQVLDDDIRELVLATVDLEKKRDSATKFNELLQTLGVTPEEYVRTALAAADDLAPHVDELSPVRTLAGDLNRYFAELDEAMADIGARDIWIRQANAFTGRRFNRDKLMRLLEEDGSTRILIMPEFDAPLARSAPPNVFPHSSLDPAAAPPPVENPTPIPLPERDVAPRRDAGSGQGRSDGPAETGE